MNLSDLDLNGLQDLVGSLRSEDIDALRDMASALFSTEPPADAAAEKTKTAPAAGSTPLPLDPGTIAKIMSLLSALQSEKKDPRCDLLYALRPMLGEERQHRVDQAAQMLQLFSILPKLKALDL